MFPFDISKKKDDSKKVYIPVDLVLRYSAQGLSEPDIIARLEEQGFHPDHIDKALRIALREKVISGAPPSPMEMQEEMPEAPSPMPFGTESMVGPSSMEEQSRMPMPLGYPPERIVEAPQKQQPQQQQQSFQQQFQQQFPEPQQQIREERQTMPATEITVEEIVEAIVAERWKEFEGKLDTFEKRDIQLQGQIEEIRRKVGTFDIILNDRERNVMGKMDEFGDSVTGIEGRIGSIERVFKDFLPELTSNIKTMSNLVETIKKEK
jgi:hypothetical protein